MQHLGHVCIGLERWREAVAHLGDSLALAAELGNHEIESECEWLLGRCAQNAGDLPAARHHLDRALARARQAADRRGEARAGAALGRLALQQGALMDAQVAMQQALSTFQHHEMRAELLASLEDMAALAHALGEFSQAGVLLGVASRARQASGLAREPLAAVMAHVLEESLRELLGDWHWTQVLTASEATTLADAVQAALALAPRRAEAAPTPG